MPPVTRVKLPIDVHLPKIIESFRAHSSLILEASPGSGKTTRVPPALLDVVAANQRIVVLEPRRIAAKLAAHRVAYEMGETPGATVGYQFRFERVSGPKTRILFLTEGMLLRLLVSDPELRGIGAVLLDEFHERHLHSDVALGYLRHLQKTARPDLKLVVMSATLETSNLEVFLADGKTKPAVLRIEAPRFPVEVKYLPSAPAKRLEDTVVEGVKQAAQWGQKGDVLVFLPGMAEIRRCEETLRKSILSNFMISPLHGDLSVDEQDRVLRGVGQRKIILSTNLAETSVTIEGVMAVVDSGLHRQASHSWWSGIPALRTRPTSRASAIQRAGRAGRTGPGFCLRLYTQGDFDGRAPFDKPEIERADLAQPLLELTSLGIRNPAQFEWFESPPKQSIEASLSLLELLGLVKQEKGARDFEWTLTEFGRRAVQLPLHPRLARFFLDAEARGRRDSAAWLAALLQEGEAASTGSLDFMGALQGAASWRGEAGVRRTAERLLSAESSKVSVKATATTKDEAIARSLLAAYPDRVAKKKVAASQYSERVELLMCGGGSASVPNSAWIQEHEFFLVLDAREKKRLNQVQSEVEIASLCAIQADWLLDLSGGLLQEKESLIWDSQRQNVSASRRLCYGDLVLSEDRTPPQDRAAAAELLLSKGLGVDLSQTHAAPVPQFLHALSTKLEVAELESLLARLELLREGRPTSGAPAVTTQWVLETLADLAGENFSLSAIRSGDLAESVRGRLDYSLGQSLDSLVPAVIILPSGRKAKIQYRFGQKPWVESRLQDFFGLRKGPSILDGRMPLLLHLLAPNYRPVQVTQDLESFWKNTYAEVRKELSRRYPRHKWPEDPTQLYKE